MNRNSKQYCCMYLTCRFTSGLHFDLGQHESMCRHINAINGIKVCIAMKQWNVNITGGCLCWMGDKVMWSGLRRLPQVLRWTCKPSMKETMKMRQRGLQALWLDLRKLCCCNMQSIKIGVLHRRWSICEVIHPLICTFKAGTSKTLWTAKI